MGSVGIERAGVYVPRYRLAAADVAAFWGQRPSTGACAVANWDEDVVTMAVEAARRCLGDGSTDDVSAVLLASTTLPYAEKSCAALVAEALDLPATVDVLDVASSLRAGTQILRLAVDRVRTTGRRVLVIAADTRPADAESRGETTWGDAAAAFLVGPRAPVTLEFLDSIYETWLAHWRLQGERYGHDGDARFVANLTEQGLRDALDRVRKAAADAGRELAFAAIEVPSAGAAAKAGASIGIDDPPRLAGPRVHAAIGYTGTPATFLSLLEALERADVGDDIAWVSWGDGTDAALVHVGSGHPMGQLLEDALAHERPMPYARYLRVRGLLPDTPVTPFSSEISQWRDARHTARLHAGCCRACGQVTYPPQRVCPGCKSYDNMADIALAREGELFTFTVEHLFPNAERRVAMGVVELDDGVRFYCPIADIDPEELKIGMRLQLVYRRLHLGGDFVNYFWKATRADREAGGS